MPATGRLYDRDRRDGVLRLVLPILTLSLAALGWQLLVTSLQLPPYVLPGPIVVLRTLFSDWAVLGSSLAVTLITTVEGLALAAVGGIVLAVLFNQSRLFEYAFYPYAVILQVTPVVAIAPL